MKMRVLPLAVFAGTLAAIAAARRVDQSTVTPPDASTAVAAGRTQLSDGRAATVRGGAGLPHRPVARPGVTGAPAALDTTAPVPVRAADRGASAATPSTYLSDVLAAGNARVKRWDDRREAPVRVWVAPGDSVSGWRPTFVPVVREAFAAWEAVGIPVRFAFVDLADDAEVRVDWTDRLSGARAGVIHRTADVGGWLTHAQIVIAMLLSDGAAASDASVHRVALHEIGHLLGLEHSTDPGDIMAAWVGAGDLTDRDRSTARLLYTLPPGPVDAAVLAAGDGV